MIREADFARLFVVWLNSVACSRVPTSAYVCINYVYVSAAGSKCFLMFPRLKKNSSCTLFRGTQVVVLKPADSFAAPCTHAFYTLTRRKPWIFSARLYYHAEYWTASEEPGEDKGPHQERWELNSHLFFMENLAQTAEDGDSPGAVWQVGSAKF